MFFYLSEYDTDWMRDNVRFIAGGLRFTLQMALGGIVIAIVLATLGALARLSRNPVAYGVAGFYVSFFRGTPLIVQMFLVYLALPQIGSNLVLRFPELGTNFEQRTVLEAATAGTIALGLNYGAYMTEIFRAGIQSVNFGQGEAADALGMTYWTKMRRIVLPQAMRVIIPPTGNEFIAMMKDTALVSFLGVTAAQAEIFRRAQLVGKADFKNLEAYVLAALLYWGLTALFTLLQGRWRSGWPRAMCVTSARRGPGADRGWRGDGAGAGADRYDERSSEPGRAGERAAQELWAERGAPRRRPGPAQGRGHRALRPVGLREVDAAAVHQLPRGPHRGHRRDR